MSMSAETLSSGAAPQKTKERELRSYLSTSGCRARKSNNVGTTATPRILYRCRGRSQSQTEKVGDKRMEMIKNIRAGFMVGTDMETQGEGSLGASFIEIFVVWYYVV